MMNQDIEIKTKKYIKILIPFVARLLITSAFIQDSIDVINEIEWPKHFNIFKYCWFFYQCNIIFSSLVCSVFIIFNKLIAPCTACLTAFSVVSLFAYHNFTDSIIITRRVSVLGGLFLLMAKGLENKKLQFKIGLPEVPMISHSTYLQLIGRIMITFLFFTQIIISSNESGYLAYRILMIVIGAAAFIMIGIGYKVKYVCSVMCVGVFIINLIINPWWQYLKYEVLCKNVRFEFFQMLGISGSLLLLANDGAGELSIDEKKKNY